MMPTARSLISRVLSPLIRAVEGQPRRGPYHLPITGGFLPDFVPVNWWQTGISPSGGGPSAVVERCIALYAETAASLRGAHWRRTAHGGRERVTSSALSRILHKPNDYETASSFMLNLVHCLYREGNAFALALRNDRYEIESLHLMNPRTSAPLVAEDGSIFFRLAGNAVIDKLLGGTQFIVPQRDVLHVKLHSGHRYPHPLVGETPLHAAMMDIAVGDAFAKQQLQFLANQARPSAVLSTDMVLDKDQVTQIRDRWNEQSKGLHQGGTPILTGGLKVHPWAIAAKDAQLAELSKLSAERIAHAFSVPLQLLGLANTPATSTETLMQFWLATGLGFCLNHIEQSFDQLFNLKGEPEDYCEFDTGALLRTAQKDRIEALVRGVQGGVYSPNEARAAEDLPAVAYGDEPRMQQQCVPLSAAAAIPAAPVAPGPQAAPAAAPAVAKAYEADLAALRARASRPERKAALNGVEPRTVIRKTKANALQARSAKQ
jgi:HK97 family phage portal protein